MKSILLATVTTSVALPALAETVRLDFQGEVTEASPLLSIAVGTTYTATALFDTDAPGAPYSFENRYQFPDGLVAFDAVIGGEAISLTEPSYVQQGDDNLLAGYLYTDEFDGTDPGATRVSGTLAGLPVVGGRFFLIPAAFEDRNGFFFSDRGSLLSGFDGTGIELPGLELGQFDVQLYDAELGYFPGFTATIAQGYLSLFEDDGGDGDSEMPTGPGEGGNGGGSPDPAPNPVPLPAGGLMLLAALGALRLRR